MWISVLYSEIKTDNEGWYWGKLSYKGDSWGLVGWVLEFSDVMTNSMHLRAPSRAAIYDREGLMTGALWKTLYVIILDSYKELLFQVTIKVTFYKKQTPFHLPHLSPVAVTGFILCWVVYILPFSLFLWHPLEKENSMGEFKYTQIQISFLTLGPRNVGLPLFTDVWETPWLFRLSPFSEDSPDHWVGWQTELQYFSLPPPFIVLLPQISWALNDSH